MKNIYILLIVVLFGCTNNSKNIKWQGTRIVPAKDNIEDKIDWSRAKVGDIVLKEADGRYLGWFGHIGILVSKEWVAEIPRFGAEVYLTHISKWDSERRIALLRYKKINPDFIDKLNSRIDDNIGKPYRIFSKKYSEGFYCSQFVWNMYYFTSKQLDFILDIDSNGGFFVFPKDILMSKELKIIDIVEKKEK